MPLGKYESDLSVENTVVCVKYICKYIDKKVLRVE